MGGGKGALYTGLLFRLSSRLFLRGRGRLSTDFGDEIVRACRVRFVNRTVLIFGSYRFIVVIQKK